MTLINSKLHRRQFLRTALATAGGIAALPALRGLGPLAVNGRVYAAPGKGGYGVPLGSLGSKAAGTATARFISTQPVEAMREPVRFGNLGPRVTAVR